MSKSPLKTYRIGIMPADGIGPEISESTKRILDESLGKHFQGSLEWIELPVGWQALEQNKPPLPRETLDELEKCDAWVMGPHDSA
ncbi:MAG: isocitrate/isopropylmalate family dehydrogenase, partial [bacterium]